MSGPSQAWLDQLAADQVTAPAVAVPPSIVAPDAPPSAIQSDVLQSLPPSPAPAPYSGVLHGSAPISHAGSISDAAPAPPAIDVGTASPAMPPPEATPAGPPSPPPQPGPNPNAFPLVAGGGGGVIPEHEVDRRAPTVRAAQDFRNEVSGQAIDRVGDRNQAAAADEYRMALDQERAARDREAAMQQSMAERDAELADRQADFDGTVQQLSRQGQLDHGRFYASLSTPQKVAGFTELMLSGFTGAPSMLLKRIDDDVKAQEFAYHATQDKLGAKQTAYSMAMQRYQHADAARAVARAAAIDVTQAQLAQMSAKWKGTDAANNADMQIAALQTEKLSQIQAAIQLVPTQNLGRRYVDPRTGLTYSEQEAKAVMAKRDDWAQADRTLEAGVGGQLAVKAAGDGADKSKSEGDRSVVVDGKNALAVNKTAAEKWNEYNHGRAVFSLALEQLKKARKEGSPAAYNAARAELIEEYPKLLGYTRAPTQGQIESTVGPEAIPEYNHWYATGPAYGIAQSRGQQKIDLLDQTLSTSDKAMRENTFGAEAGQIDGPVKASELPKSATVHRK